MRKLFVVFSIALLLAIGTYAEALSYSFIFEGTDDAGRFGSATMDIDITGTTLTLTLENTTPISEGAAGITGFGFDLDPDKAWTSWSLTAYDKDLNLMTIGSNTLSGDDYWKMDTTMAGVTFDYLPTTPGENIKGALYNPDAVGSSDLAALPNYFTTATLVMEFADLPVALELDEFGDLVAPFVRMQNVGIGGGGSLKLYGDPKEPEPPSIVPEPSTVFLLGLGLLGILGVGRKLKK